MGAHRSDGTPGRSDARWNNYRQLVRSLALDSYPSSVTTLRDLLAACDGSIRRRLEPDEEVLAVGRCEDVTDRGSIESGGAAWTFVMVTNRRLRWVTRSQLRFEAALDLENVTHVAEQTDGHRYALTLGHDPLRRRHWVPAHRFLIFTWGNAETYEEFRRTRLAFSRPNTVAAQALRDELRRRGKL
jgi:hypothetical protein